MLRYYETDNSAKRKHRTKSIRSKPANISIWQCSAFLLREQVYLWSRAVWVLADASEITGLPRDNFEVWEITREEFEGFRPN